MAIYSQRHRLMASSRSGTCAACSGRSAEPRTAKVPWRCKFSPSWQHSAVLKRCRHSHRCNIRRSKVVIASLNCDSAPIGFAPSCPCNGSTGSRTHRLTPACTRACTYARAHTRAHARARTRMHARAHAIHTHECRLAGAMHFRWNLCEENCFATSHDGLVSAPAGYSAYLQIRTHAFRLLLLCAPLRSCLVACRPMPRAERAGALPMHNRLCDGLFRFDAFHKVGSSSGALSIVCFQFCQPAVHTIRLPLT